MREDVCDGEVKLVQHHAGALSSAILCVLGVHVLVGQSVRNVAFGGAESAALCA